MITNWFISFWYNFIYTTPIISVIVISGVNSIELTDFKIKKHTLPNVGDSICLTKTNKVYLVDKVIRYYGVRNYIYILVSDTMM